MNVEKIGKNILFYLKEKGMTQVELAEGLNASKQVINKIIRGKKALKIQELIAISEFLEITLEDLIDGEKGLVENELEAVHLYGKIENKSTADFIINLIDNLSTMEEELAAHGLLQQ